MTTTNKNLLVFALCFAAAWLSSFVYVQQNFYGDEEFRIVLRAGARVAILIYLLVFIARPLRQLTGSDLSRSLLKHRRQLGVAFAAVMTAHLWFLLWLNGPVVPIPGMIIYAFIFLMLITSFEGPTRALGPKRWRILHKTGLYVIGLALAQAQFGRIIGGVGEPVHYVLASLFLVAIVIRVLAWRKQRTPSAS